MPDRSLLIAFDEVRRKTLYLLDGVTPEEALWTPPALQNSILWHAGHSYILLEWLSMQSLARQPQAPAGWFEMFSWESRPADIADDAWPPLSEVVQSLRDQHTRLRSLFSELSEPQLCASATGRPNRSVRYYILHALHDEACHSGEIWLLRKMQACLKKNDSRS